MSLAPGQRRTPATAPTPPASAVSSWSALNPADDDLDDHPPPPPPAPKARRRKPPAAPPATASVPTAPPARPRLAPRPAGPSVARTEQTGRPRVDWKAYDAQVYDAPPEWVLYRCWTRVPLDRRWYVRAIARVLILLTGRLHYLLWVGISMRAGIARATEHLADKPWRRLIHKFEIDPDAGDAGPPGARYFTTGAAAQAYETARIKAEHPKFNTRDNDRAYNPNATHLTKRIKAQHVADRQQQAGKLALGWLAVAAACTGLLWPDTMPADLSARMEVGFEAIMSGVAGAAAVMMAARIGRLAILGAQPTTARRNRILRRGR